MEKTILLQVPDKIIYRYHDMLVAQNCDYKPIQDKYGDQMGGDHLLWMLDTIQYGSLSATKQHRWLGYVQGILIATGITTVAAERDATRGLFNGI